MPTSSLTPLEPADIRLGRRRFLATVGAVSTSALAGCSGRLPGTNPKSLDAAVHEDSEDELSWNFPAGAAEENRVGYVEIGREPSFDSDGAIPTAGFHCNASIDPSSDYALDRFIARFSTPEEYHLQYGDATYLAEPPANADNFRTYYRRHSTYREFSIELRDVATDGTTRFPLVVRDAERLPPALRCSVSLRASESGTFGEAIRVSDAGRFEFGTGRQDS